MEKKLTNRQIQAVNSKNKIYNAAIELLENVEFDNIRIEDICKRASVSIGSFYTHFNKKYDILVEVFKQAETFSGMKSQNLWEIYVYLIKSFIFLTATQNIMKN